MDTACRYSTLARRFTSPSNPHQSTRLKTSLHDKGLGGGSPAPPPEPFDLNGSPYSVIAFILVDLSASTRRSKERTLGNCFTPELLDAGADHISLGATMEPTSPRDVTWQFDAILNQALLAKYGHLYEVHRNDDLWERSSGPEGDMVIARREKDRDGAGMSGRLEGRCGGRATFARNRTSVCAILISAMLVLTNCGGGAADREYNSKPR